MLSEKKKLSNSICHLYIFLNYPIAASMSYRQLEEAINKWTLELEEQEKVFLNQATQVNAWDRLLMSNGEKIVKLHESVEKVKLDQQVSKIIFAIFTI